MLEFWRHMLPSNFSQELHVYFSMSISMEGPILHELQQHGFVGMECVGLTGLHEVQIYLLLKMYGTSWRGESDNGDHRLLSISSLVYTKNGQKCHLQNCKNCISSVPKRLQSVIKRKSDVTQW